MGGYQQLQANPLAADITNGYNDAAPGTAVDYDFTYVYNVVLTGNQFLQNQSVVTTNDADFLWLGTIVASATGTFNVRFSDSQGYYFSNTLIASANIQGDASSPDPVFPSHMIIAGGRIGIDIQDTSGSGNTIQLLFRGIKRYRANVY